MKTLRTVVIGLGKLGMQLTTDVNNDNNLGIELVCALDDDTNKHDYGLSSGYEVVDTTESLENLIDKLDLDQVIIAITNANQRFLNELVYRSLRREMRTICLTSEHPSIYESEYFNVPIVKKNLSKLQEFNTNKKINAKSNQNDTILVTGGAGYIGNHLVRDLLNSGYKVVVLDYLYFGSNGLEDLMNNKNLTFINGSIENIRDIFKSIDNVKYVIALAAIVGDPACGIDAENTMIINYESTKILVEACNYFGVEKLVFASSCSVYGASYNGNFLNEDSDLNPVSLYARTRIFSENYIFDNAINYSPTVLRLSTVFGYSKRMRFDLVVNLFVIKALVEKKIEIFGGNQWRPFVHCQDVAKAFKYVVQTDESIVRNKIYNVGNENLNFTIDQVGNIVKEILPDTEIINNGEIDDPRNYKVSFQKIENDLDYTTDFDITSGVENIINEVTHNPNLKSYKDKIYSNYLTFKDL